MSQQVLGSPTSRVLGAAVMAVARAVETAPDPRLRDTLDTREWPLHDPESRRGAALLAESRLAAESTERLHADHARLFLGGPQRPPIARTAVPEVAVTSLERLYGDIGVLVPSGQPGLVHALETFADLLTPEPAQLPQAATWRRELLDEHLLTWGARCLSRAQLGARTFFYQGVAALALGLLSSVAADAATPTTADA